MTDHPASSIATSEEPTAQKAGTRWKRNALLYLTTALLATLVYHPWRDAGFDLEDFSEFRPILEHASSPSSRFTALTEYYGTQGRWNVVGFAFLAVKWTAFGPNPVPWQWLRLIQMLAVAGSLFHFIVTIGVSRLVAWASATLFLFSSAAAASVVRLTLGEPLALMFLLGALLLGTKYQETERWKACGLGISLCVGLILATKEVLIACVPFVLAFGVSWRGHAFRPVEWSKRNAFLTAAVAAIVVLVSIPIIHARMGIAPSAYSSAYKASSITAAKFLVLAFDMVMPVQHSPPPDIFPLLYPANVIIAILGGSGLLIWSRFGVRAPRPLPFVGGAFFLALAGALVYVPWPRFEEFYALPFTLGGIVVLAFATDAAGERARLANAVAVGTLLLATFYAVLAANASVEFRFARRGATNDLVHALRSLQHSDSVVVLTSDPGSSWHQRAGTLERAMQNEAHGAAVPRVVGVGCADAAKGRMLTPTLHVVNYVSECGRMRETHAAVARRFDYVDWQSLHSRQDSFVIELKRGNRP